MATQSEIINEVVEEGIETRWADLQKKIKNIIDEKSSFESGMREAEDHLKEFEDEIKDMHQAFVAKMGEFDKKLIDIKVDLQTIQMVMNKLLPSLHEEIKKARKIK